MTTVTHVSERLLPMSPVCTTFRAVGAGLPTFAAKPPGFDDLALARHEREANQILNLERLRITFHPIDRCLRKKCNHRHD